MQIFQRAQTHTAGIRAAPFKPACRKTPPDSFELCERLTAIPSFNKNHLVTPLFTSTALDVKGGISSEPRGQDAASAIPIIKKTALPTGRPHPKIRPPSVPAETLLSFRALCPAPQSSARTACPRRNSPRPFQMLQTFYFYPSV